MTVKLPTFISALLWKSLTIGLIPLFAWIALESLDPHLPKADDPPKLYANQVRADLTLTLSKAIERAQESVHLAIYTLYDTKICHALKQKAEEGKRVYVLYDKGCKGVEKRLGPKVEAVKRSISGLMHQKVLVIDRKEIWIGSANFTSDALRNQPNLMIALNSEDLAASILATLTTRLPSGPPFPLARHAFEAVGQRLEFWQQPSDKGALERIIAVIGEAKESLRIAMYTFTHPALTEAVVAAHERGVEVEAVIDRSAGEGSSKKTVERLVGAHVPVRLSRGPSLFHHKLAWIDGSTLICGSTNWTKAAFTKNEDSFVILYELNGEQQETLEKMWRHSVATAVPMGP
ncbi:MAG: phosphatidylserine/phosphatidylglycerophosphate/cardiolipin synthase family protein [Parachlamydiales bacterium]